MRSDAPYTALLVARGDDNDEFRREDVAARKDNSSAYGNRGREKPTRSKCGEVTHTAYTVRKTLDLLLIAGADV